MNIKNNNNSEQTGSLNQRGIKCLSHLPNLKKNGMYLYSYQVFKEYVI